MMKILKFFMEHVTRKALAVLAIIVLLGGAIGYMSTEVMGNDSIEARTCAITHWFINGATPYRAYVGGVNIGNIPANTRITRIYGTRSGYTNIRVALDSTIPLLFRGGAGWVLTNRVSGFRPAPPCVAEHSYN